MAKNDDKIEELTDEVFQLNSKYDTLAGDVGSIKESMKRLADAAEKPIPPPQLDDMKVRFAITSAVNDYFQRHPVGKTMSEEDRIAIADKFYQKYLDGNRQYFKEQREKQAKDKEEREEKRNEQGIYSDISIQKWALEYPLEVCFWLWVISDKVIPPNWKGDYIQPYIKKLGNVFMAVNGLSEPTLKGYLKHKWTKFKERTDKWSLLKWYAVIVFVCATVIMHQVYLERVMKIEQANHIFYRHIMSDPVKAKEYHDIDSLVNTQTVLKKLWNTP